MESTIRTTNDFEFEVAKGNVPGHAIFEKYGRNNDVDTGTAPEDIWNGGGDYTGFPTGAAETLEVFSSNSNDTSAGTGARTIEISNLLDGLGNEMTPVVVSLNGTTTVSLGAQTYGRCSRARVLTVGSSGGNLGEITVRHTTTTSNIFAVTPIDRNSTAILAYTVPLGKTLYINRATFSMARANGSAGSANMTLRARGLGGAFESLVSPEITNSQGFKHENNGWFKFEERTDVKGRCESVSDNNTIITGEWGGILVDN